MRSGVHKPPSGYGTALKALRTQYVHIRGGRALHSSHVHARTLARRPAPPEWRHAPPHISYLDIGCGNGFMLQAAKELGFEDPWGVEPSAHAIRHLHPAMQGRIMQGMFSLTLLQGKRFDVISCFQTLDHIPDPITFVGEVFEALKPGGTVLFVNHNIASLTARLLKEHCPMIDIEHTFLHTPSTMRALFGSKGFMDVRVHAVRNDYPLHYWIHLLPGPRNIKRPMVDFLKRSAMGRTVIPLYAGNLGLIARKPQ